MWWTRTSAGPKRFMASWPAPFKLVLKEYFAYPIGTYQEIKRDTMQALLNAFSNLTKEDGAGIQILLRPADNSWRKHAIAHADAKRTGKAKNKGLEKAFSGAGQVFTALNKPPETGDSEPQKPKDERSEEHTSNSSHSQIS